VRVALLVVAAIAVPTAARSTDWKACSDALQDLQDAVEEAVALGQVVQVKQLALGDCRALAVNAVYHGVAYSDCYSESLELQSAERIAKAAAEGLSLDANRAALACR
jgi:hypothetical protein